MSITTPLSARDFYARDVWGNPFSRTHRGRDIERAALRPVPHLFAGSVIVLRGSNSELGAYAVDDRGPEYAGQGRYIGYGHVTGGRGNELGHVADYDENHGSAWSAPHVHLTVSDDMRALFTRSLPTYDPTPFLAAAIGSSSAGGTPPELIDEEEDMNTDQDAKLSAIYAALFGPKNLNAGNGPNEMSWVNVDGDVQKARYGVLPILIRNQQIVAELLVAPKATVNLEALASAIVAKLPTSAQLDPAKIAAATKQALAADFASVMANIDDGSPVDFPELIIKPKE